MDTFVKATNDFLADYADFGVVDSATLHSIKAAAEQLDKKFTTSLLQEYLKTVRYIKSLAPQQENDEDEHPLLSPE